MDGFDRRVRARVCVHLIRRRYTIKQHGNSLVLLMEHNHLFGERIKMNRTSRWPFCSVLRLFYSKCQDYLSNANFDVFTHIANNFVDKQINL